MYVGVIAVLVLPLLFVLVSSRFDAGLRTYHQHQSIEAANRLSGRLRLEQTVDTSAWPGLVEQVAAEYAVRIRIVDHAGHILAESNHDSRKDLWYAMGDLFFGPEQVATLLEFDSELEPLSVRPEVIAAFESGMATGCRHASEGSLLVCHAAEKVGFESLGRGAIVVYAQESSRRAIRVLFSYRRQLIKLLFFVLPLGLVLAFWLSRSVVKPVERLRNQVVGHSQTATAHPDFDTGTRDEIGDLASAFNSLLAALAERNRQNEAFVADLAHEFKNPVAAIRAAAEKIATSDIIDDQKAKRLGNILLASSSKLDRLVSDFLALARAEAGLVKESRSTVDLTTLAQGLVETIQSDERYSHIRFSARTSKPATCIHGVPRQVEIALSNLLENAATHVSANGEVTITIDELEREVRVRVKDNGPGIESANLPRVFDRFFTTRASDRGTGLGLALTKAIIEAHGGRVSVESLLGQGATFSLFFPFKPDLHSAHRNSSS